MSDFSFSDAVGIFGVTIVLFVYYLLQIEKMTVKDLSFSSLNALGSSMILYSLLYSWNLSSVLIEVIWILISIIGIVKYFKK